MAELPVLAWKWPELLRQPRGNGGEVFVLPGFGADDVSTFILRKYLGLLGYKARGWALGRNGGDIRGLVPRMIAAVEKRAMQKGPVRLVGWSMGGVVAREVARERPELVERVITLGSPICGLRLTFASGLLALAGYDLAALEAEEEARNQVPIKVPITAIYSPYDGIVSAQGCLDRWNRDVEHVEVTTTHLGLGVNVEVYKIIAQRLARRRKVAAVRS